MRVDGGNDGLNDENVPDGNDGTNDWNVPDGGLTAIRPRGGLGVARPSTARSGSTARRTTVARRLTVAIPAPPQFSMQDLTDLVRQSLCTRIRSRMQHWSRSAGY